MDYGFYQAPAQAYQYPAFPPTPAQTFEQPESQVHDAQELYHPPSAFSGFDPSYFPGPFPAPPPEQHDDQPHGLPQQPQQPPEHPHQEHSPPLTDPPHSGVAVPSVEPQNSNGSVVTNGTGEENEQSAEQNGHRSSSEDKETMTLAQSRRKAQNRAAQRAFRERKERHVKDLESKLNSLSAHSTTLLTDNERLKRELQRLATQNEILRATTGPHMPNGGYPNGAGGPAGGGGGGGPRSPSPVAGPQTFLPTDFQAAVGVDPDLHPVSFEDFGGQAGQRLLAAGATWDLIQGHELFRRGQLDIADVCRRLKGRASCDGRGPAFKEAEVLRAIDESTIAASDELI